jgi:hypothetical protein
MRATRALAFPLVPMARADFDRAADVLEALARRGQHRAVGLPDLLIAAVAERAGLTVLHYDADYDLVAAVTGQPTRWIVPRGAVPCPVPAVGCPRGIGRAPAGLPIPPARRRADPSGRPECALSRRTGVARVSCVARTGEQRPRSPAGPSEF